MTPVDALRGRLSRLGFGCASYWAKPVFPRRRAIALVHEAIELGVTVFDTGPMYAAGEAERRLGAALAGRDRAGLVVMSKAGEATPGAPHKDFSPFAIERSVTGSLQRLGVERIDVLWLHGCPRNGWSDDLREGLQRLKTRGLVDLVGLNSFDADDLDAAVDEQAFDALMFDVNFTRPDNSRRAALAANQGKLVFSAAALARAPWNRSWWQVRSPADAWYWLRAWRQGATAGTKSSRAHEAEPPACAGAPAAATAAQRSLQWSLAQPGVTCALFATTRPAHLRENAACLVTSSPPMPER